MKKFRIFGMRRSGNHAIIEWISSHFNKTTHFNDCLGWKDIRCRTNEIYGCGDNFDSVIYSYEDFAPNNEEIKRAETILIFRDWYNMMSSRLLTNRDKVRHKHSEEESDEVLETWLEYAKLYCEHPNKFILYNHWATDPNYRKIIQKKFNLNDEYDKFTSDFPKSKIGKGSSFDKNKLNLNNVNKRHQLIKLSNPEIYEKIINKEVTYYCKTIFNIEI